MLECHILYNVGHGFTGIDPHVRKYARQQFSSHYRPGELDHLLSSKLLCHELGLRERVTFCRVARNSIHNCSNSEFVESAGPMQGPAGRFESLYERDS